MDHVILVLAVVAIAAINVAAVFATRPRAPAPGAAIGTTMPSWMATLIALVGVIVVGLAAMGTITVSTPDRESLLFRWSTMTGDVLGGLIGGGLTLLGVRLTIADLESQRQRARRIEIDEARHALTQLIRPGLLFTQGMTTVFDPFVHNTPAMFAEIDNRNPETLVRELTTKGDQCADVILELVNLGALPVPSANFNPPELIEAANELIEARFELAKILADRPGTRMAKEAHARFQTECRRQKHRLNASIGQMVYAQIHIQRFDRLPPNMR